MNVRRNIVFIAAPQGAAGGGMGRVKDYIIEAAPSAWPDLRTLHLVTRDESTKLQSLFLLLKALGTIFRHRREILLVHVNIGDKGSAARKSVVTLFSRLLRLPTVLHLHAVELEQMPGPALALLGFVFRSATAVVVLGERYRRWVIDRLGVKPRGEAEDRELARATLALLADGGERLRWEPFFFDWFGGLASEARARAGPRAEVYAGPAFEAFRAALDGYEADRPERLQAAYFQRPEPEELLYDEIERIWAAIADRDDWAPFHAKIAAIGEARDALSIAVS